jgi:hypothetical protein
MTKLLEWKEKLQRISCAVEISVAGAFILGKQSSFSALTPPWPLVWILKPVQELVVLRVACEPRSRRDSVDKHILMHPRTVVNHLAISEEAIICLPKHRVTEGPHLLLVICLSYKLKQLIAQWRR